MKQLTIFIFLLLSFAACHNADKNTLVELPSDSVFNLGSEWQNQDGETIKLADLKGKTTVMVMIYTSCKLACPRLVANMKQIEKEIKTSNIPKVSLVLVTIDPKVDTPEILKKFAKTNGMDAEQWVFLRGNEETTQELANVLSMKYKQISPIDFSHSNIITIFNPSGQMESQEEGLEINTKGVAKKVNEVVAKSS